MPSLSDLPLSFDRFQVSRILGKGGMGTVYLARDVRLDRLVALKVLHDENLKSEEKKHRFFREARTAASIRHPNVATIYEVGEGDDGAPFIVMEYCEGETLSQRIRRRPLEAAEFLSIARQIAAGVTAAHDAGVIHRDLKSANIMIEPTGQVKILDFGLAKAVHRELTAKSLDTTSRKLFGTLHYLSPEQTRGQAADARSDLFSLGVVFYQMATGQFPFNADGPLLVLEKIRDAEPEPFVPSDPAFPPSAARVIGKLLQKDPAQRYESARDLLEDIEAIDLPTVRHPTLTTRSMIGRTMSRPRWGFFAAILVAFLAGGYGIYVLQSRSKPPAESPASPPPPIRSMAVLPLENLSNNTRDDFLSVSLADALVTKLQKMPSLQVRPTSAVMEFHNKKVDAKSASEALRVDGVLEGHFLAAGDLVRVNLQLTDSRVGQLVWADTVDGRRDDLLKLIDEVSTRTVSGLNEKLALQPAPARGSEPRSSNPKAFEQYLRARAIDGSLDPAEHAQQITALKKAVALDPKFAAAYADLAIALSLGQARGLERDPGTAERAEWYARQAVRLDPNLAEAHLALGRTFVRFAGRFRESVRENLAALRINPGAEQALHTAASYFASVGDTQKTKCVYDRMMRIDPNANEVKTRGYEFVNEIDPEGALQASNDAMGSRNTELAAHDIRANAFLILGNIPAAQEEAQKAKALVPGHYIGKSLAAMVAAANGDRAACEAALHTFEAEAMTNHWAAMRQALCYAKLGDRDNAMKWVRQSADGGNHSWAAWVKHPWLQSLQPDPEFQTVVAKMKADLDDVRDDVIGVYQMLCP